MTLHQAWLLFSHFLALSMLAVGGAITTAPDMKRYFVDEMHWLSTQQFNASIAIAQGCPGPNVLFVALLGWQLGANLGSAEHQWWAGMVGMMLAMLGVMLPSSILVISFTRWLRAHQTHLAVRAFKSGLAPISVALMFATAWTLASASRDIAVEWRLWIFCALCCALVYFTRVHLMVVIALGLAVGALGWV